MWQWHAKRKTTQKWATKSRGDTSELHGVAEGGANFCLHTYEFPNVETFECEEVVKPWVGSREVGSGLSSFSFRRS